jgi:excisionase family DNA binding protein
MKQAVEETRLDRMLTVRQVADFLQVSICSVRRWSDRGTLKFYRVGSRGDRRYQQEDVLRFLDESSRYFMPENRTNTG